MKVTKFIEQIKMLNYDIFVENKNKLPQGQVPDEVEIYRDGQGNKDPKLKVVDGNIVIE